MCIELVCFQEGLLEIARDKTGEIMPDLRYPIGEFQVPKDPGVKHRETWLDEIEAAPGLLRAAVEGLSPEQLDTPYREGGWTVRQVVHHVPDSHMNSYVRFKLALTEDRPTIRGYDQDGWAGLEDSLRGPIAPSLDILEALHRRWLHLLRGLDTADFERSFIHPDLGPVSLWTNLAYYAWHGRHHVAQITSLMDRQGWG